MVPLTELLARLRAAGPLWLGGIVSLGVFLLAVQLLGTATEAATAPLRRLFSLLGTGDGHALGFSWLATYGLTNGSVIAALSIALFESGVVTASQLFLMVAGSRLGAAAIVVVIGALDYIQKRQYTVSEATSLGVLTFLVTHTLFLPATVLGYLCLPWLRALLDGLGRQFGGTYPGLSAVEPITVAVVDGVGPVGGVVLAVSLFLGSLVLFDRVLERVDTDWLRQRFFRRFRNRWVALGLGVLVTGITTSVAFSLGVIVPLYNRRYLERREVVPYVLGANIGTLFDTVIVAAVLRSTVGVTTVLALLAVGSLLTLAVMLRFEAYLALVETVHDRLLQDRRSFQWFLLTLVALPLVFALLPI